MGNNLCKSNGNTSSVRNPFENLSISCPSICPLPKSKEDYWKKQVISPRPQYFDPTAHTRKWQNAPTLVSTQPLTMNQKTVREYPVPPPRRKRLRNLSDVNEPPKNGFKDVFGAITVETSPALHAESYHSKSRESIDTVDGQVEAPPRHQTKLKVGNKKTDKFFGENLSDALSDQPVHENNETESLDRKFADIENLNDETNVDKKAAFLMTMLENYHDDFRYKGKEPVQEAQCRKVRKVRKHICDDDHLPHTHDHENQIKGPKKPQRDIELYRKSKDEKEIREEELKEEKEVSKETENKVPSPPIRRKRSLSQSKEPEPQNDDNVENEKHDVVNFVDSPIHPMRLKTNNENQSKLLTKKLSMPCIPKPMPERMSKPSSADSLNEAIPAKKLGRHTKVLKKSMSTHSFMSNDLMDALIKRNYGFEPFNIEDMGYSCKDDDGSSAVAKNITKLRFRKISSQDSIKGEPGSPDTVKTEPKIAKVEDKKAETPEKVKENPIIQASDTVKEEPKIAHKEMKTAEAKVEKSTEKEVPVISITEVGNDEEEQEPKAESKEVVKVESKVEKIVEQRMMPSTREKDKEVSFSSTTEAKETTEPPQKPPRRLSKTCIDLEAVVASAPIRRVKDVVEDIYQNQKEIVLEFQKFLEEELQKSPSLIEIYKNEAELEKDVMEVIKRTEQELARANKSDLTDEVLAAANVKPDNESAAPLVAVQVLKEENVEDNNTLQVATRKPRERQESINEAEPWFVQHYDIPTESIPQEISVETAATNYDENKLFPFGDILKRHDSMTDEFFDESPIFMKCNIEKTVVSDDREESNNSEKEKK